MSSERKLRFMSWNSNGLKTKIDKVKHQIKQQNCDVVFLQETRSGESNVLELLEGEYKSFYTTQTSNSSGVAIIIKTNILEETRYTIEKDPAGCYILVKCTLKGQLFTLVSVYSSQSDTNPLLKLRNVLEKHAEGILLIGGDFNVALNPYLDRPSTKRNNNHSLMRLLVEEFMTSFHLVDVWRRFHPKAKQYSFKRSNSKTPGEFTFTESRLDYIFVPEETMQYIKKCDFSQFNRISDHTPVVFKIIFEESYELKLFLTVFKEEDTKDVSSFQISVIDKWLSCKRQHCPNIDLTVNSYTSQRINCSEIERAIQSLIVNDVERPDGLPLSFYKSYSYVLIPYLCTFYKNILEQATNIPEAFNAVTQVSETYYCIFNVDYLILATIMARWLYEHLQTHSTHCTFRDNKNSMLLTFKWTPIKVKWSTLKNALAKEQDKHRTEPPLQDRFKFETLQMMLNTNPSSEQKCLLWGCPLTPVLMTLYLKHVANEMIETVKDPKPSIHISRENVIVRFSDKFDTSLLDNLKGKYKKVDFANLENMRVTNFRYISSESDSE